MTRTLRRDLQDGRSVLGGPVADDSDPRWLCAKCGREFGGTTLATEDAFRELAAVNGELLGLHSRLLTAGLAAEAKAIARATRVVAERASAFSNELGVDDPDRLLGMRRGKDWNDEETILALDLVTRTDAFPSHQDVAEFAEYVGRSVGAVRRKLALMSAARDGAVRGLRRRSRVDYEVLERYASDVASLRRAARAIRRRWNDPLPEEREPSELRRLEYEFWAQLVKLLESEGTTVRIARPVRGPWYDTRIGRAGFSLSLGIDTRDRELACSLIIQHSSAKSAFAQLEADRDSVEGETGAVEWHQLPNRKRARITQRRALDLTARETWPEVLSWAKDRLETFHRCFAPRVKKLLL